MKAAFVTLGCKVNQYETNALRQMLLSQGIGAAAPEEEADIYIVNSCTVTAESSRKSRQALRKLRKEHPGAITVLTGCYSQAYKDELESLTEADIVLGNKTNAQLTQAILDFAATKQRKVIVSAHERTDAYIGVGAASFEGHTRAFLKIQDGCNRYCTYCIIPRSRGFSRSRPLPEINAELETIAANGYKEVVFAGINLSAYGLDTEGTILAPLRLAEQIPGIERIRLGSLEPDHITDEVIDGLRQLSKFCPQFHLSLQSGCNKTLRRMNRHYTAEEYAALCARLKQAFPDLSLTTDIIVGFPGETEEDFRQSMAFAKEIGFMKVHVFPYSAREGTPAAGYPDQIDKQLKIRRCAELQKACDKLRETFLRAMIGKTEEVLFETPKNNMQQGYTRNYTPVAVSCDTPLCGQILQVTVRDVRNGVCIGEVKQ